MDPFAQVAVLLGLTLINAFFAGAEIAILAVRKSRLRELAEQSGAAASALALREAPEQLLATVQIGITVAGAASGAFGGAFLEQPFEQAFRMVGLGRAAPGVAFVVVVSLVASLSVILGELVPKSLALRSSERFALFAAPVLHVLARLARPAVWTFVSASNLMLRPFRDTTTFSESRLSPEELQQLVEEAAESGSLDAKAGEIASRALDLAKLRISAIMVPRTAISGVRADASIAQVREVLRTRPHARYLISDVNGEGFQGYVMARDLYEQLVDGKLDIPSILRKVPFFPEQASAVSVLRELQSSRTRIGLVVDEYGTISGLVSLEDIGEELVGEIFAEHEAPNPQIREEAPDVFLVMGSAAIHEINRELGCDLPSGPTWSTIAGLLLHRSGGIPKIGDRITLDKDLEAEIVEASVAKVKSLRLRFRGVASSKHDGSGTETE